MFVHAGAKDAINAAFRTMFGAEANEMSLLYLLAYCAAAGGFEPLISANEAIGGQEFKVKVYLFIVQVAQYNCSLTSLSQE